MISEANQKAIEAAGLSFILGMKIPDVPYAVGAVAEAATQAEDIPDGHVFTQPWPAGPSSKPPRPGDLLPVQGRPGAAHAARR